MEWLTFEGINWLAVAIAFVVSFACGWWFYSNAGLLSIWKRAAKISGDDLQNASMGVAFGATIIANVLGAILGVVYRAGAHALHKGFAVRSPAVTLPDGLHDVVGLALAGVILGLF